MQGALGQAPGPVRPAASLSRGAARRLNELGGEGAIAEGTAGGTQPIGPPSQAAANPEARSRESSSQEGTSQDPRSQAHHSQAQHRQGEANLDSPSQAAASQEGVFEDSRLGASSAGERVVDPGTIEEGAVRLQAGSGFFRPESRPSRDLGVLLAQHLAAQRRRDRPEAPGLRVLDLMAGCGIRSLRYGIEAGAAGVWANDADPDRLALLQANLAGFGGGRCTTRTAQKLLAGCLLREQRFDLIDLDAFGCPSALVPLALEALAFDGVLYLASTDGRSPTGHDRPAAIRSLGAAARAHPASWELALRLQLGVQARAAWVLGRGLEPVFSFSEGRTFRTAVRLRRKPGPQAERLLGLLAHCHGCGDQQVQSLFQLRQWRPCLCPDQANARLSISGPLWIGPLQDPASLEAMASAPGADSASLSPAGARLLVKLRRDDGLPARGWPLAELAKRLGGGPPPLEPLVQALRQQGWSAQASAVMPAQLRSDAPWDRLLAVAAHVSQAGAAPAPHDAALNR